MSTPCPDCGEHILAPDKADFIPLSGGVRIETIETPARRTDRVPAVQPATSGCTWRSETGPALLNRPWSAFDLDLRYDRQIRFLRWVVWGLALLVIGIIVGKLML